MEFCFLLMNGIQLVEGEKDWMFLWKGPGGKRLRTAGRELALAKRRHTMSFGGGKMVIT